MRLFPRKVLAAVGLTMVAVMTTTAPVEAAIQNSQLTGTVNCTGSWTRYNVVRYMTGYSDLELYVSKVAYGERGTYSMDFGAYVIALDTSIRDGYVMSADRWTTISTSQYIPNTRFRMEARMTEPSGACHNVWAGSLYY